MTLALIATVLKWFAIVLVSAIALSIIVSMIVGKEQIDEFDRAEQENDDASSH